jgi:hypothetical protein
MRRTATTACKPTSPAESARNPLSLPPTDPALERFPSQSHDRIRDSGELHGRRQ